VTPTAPSIVDRRSGVTVAVAVLVANLSNYGFQIVTGRLLTVDEYGLLAGFMSAITIIAVSTSALQTAAAKAVAVGQNRPDERGYFDKLTKTAMFGGLAFGVVVALAAPVLSKFFKIGLLPIFFLGAYAIPSSLDSIAAGRLQGAKRFRAFAGYSAAQAIAKLGLASILILAGFRVGGLIAGLALSSAAVAMWGMTTSREVGAISTHILGEEVRRGFFAVLLLWVIVSIDLAFARAYFTPHAAGVYAAAAVLGKAVLWLPAVITQLVFPHLAEQSANKEKTSHLLRRAVLVILAISGTAVVGLYLLGGPVFTILYGDRYDGASDIAWKIGLAMLPLTIVNLLLYQFIARGQNRFLVWMGLAAVGEVIALFFVPKTATAYAITIGSVGLAALLFMLPSVSDWHRKSPLL
jgi:O-antigen/teichoic acid export membrane protein